MSMLIAASAQVWKIAAAMPGWSGTPTTVILASLRSWATPAMMGASTGSPSAGWSVTIVPSFAEKELRTWIGMSKRRAYSTLRRCSTLDPDAASSSISSPEMRGILRAVGTIRGSAVKIPSTSV
jgi:hypothetical protein